MGKVTRAPIPANIGEPSWGGQRGRQLLVLLFVGERPSHRAHAAGWTLADGRLAGKTLHDAVRALGLDPARQAFRNLWRAPEPDPTDAWHQARALAFIRRSLDRRGFCPVLVVGLGRKVCRVLRDAEIPHVELVHPAARGRIRKGRRYAAHVRQRLARHLPEE